MRKILLLLLILLPFALMAQQNTYLPNTIVVKVSPQLKSNAAQSLYSITNTLGIGVQKVEPMFPNKQKQKNLPSPEFNLSTIFLIETESPNIDQQILLLQKNKNIIYAHPYYLPQLLEEPNDPYRGRQYYLELVEAYRAHKITTGDTNIVIGIVDTGTDLYHEDLVDNYKYNYNDPVNGIDDDLDGYIDNYWGWDMGDHDNNPQSFRSHHGTKVAGMASATANNETGIYSVGHKTKLLTIKAMDNRGELSGSYQGIVYAADHGADIINCSWGSTFPSPLCDDVVNYATNYKGCLIIAAAGNAKTNEPYYPASCQGVFSVGASNANDIKWNSSTYGVELDIMAPGESVYTTNYNDGYTFGWGTSYAAPLVAGAAALVKSEFPEYKPQQIAEQLRITADVIDTLTENQFYFHQMGYGRLNVYRALSIKSMPSVRITELHKKQVYHNANEGIYTGDTLEVRFDATNYLTQATNTVVRLTTDSDLIDIENNTFSLGQMGTLQSKSNNDNPFYLVYNQNPPYDHQIMLKFQFNDAGYNDYQWFKHTANPSFLTVEFNHIKTTYTSNGALGYAVSEKKLGNGLIYKNMENILNNGGLIIGNSNQNMASAAWGDADFVIEKKVDTTTINKEYLQGVTAFSSHELTQLPLKIIQETKGYYTKELPSTIINSYQIINTGQTLIENIKAALFADWELHKANANITGFDNELNLFYTQSNTNQVLYSGICLLNSNSGTPYGFDLITGGNGGLDITDGFSSDQKWFAMNNPRVNAGNNGDTINVATMLSSAPFSIPANDTSEIGFALIVADNLLHLKEQAQEARELYLRTSIEPSTSPLESKVLLFPNPTRGVLHINAGNFYNGKLIIYNIQGTKVLEKSITESRIAINTSSFSPGVYYVELLTTEGKVSRKVIIQ